MTWMDHAACAGTDPNIWFPDEGGSAARAKAICAACPARRECEDAGRHETHGIWGGLTPAERQRARRGIRIVNTAPVDATIDHGTMRGYRQHMTRRVPSCAACKAVYAAWRSDQRRGTQHGTWAGYVAHVGRNRRPCALCAAVIDTSVIRALKSAALAVSWALRDQAQMEAA